jgi:hypothetical protein
MEKVQDINVCIKQPRAVEQEVVRQGLQHADLNLPSSSSNATISVGFILSLIETLPGTFECSTSSYWVQP